MTVARDVKKIMVFIALKTSSILVDVTKAVNYKVESSGDSPESVTSQISPVASRLREWGSGSIIDFGS